jgi:hypothetical protein
LSPLYSRARKFATVCPVARHLSGLTVYSPLGCNGHDLSIERKRQTVCEFTALSIRIGSMIFFLTTLSLWVSGVIIVGLGTALSMLGPILVRRYVDVQ